MKRIERGAQWSRVRIVGEPTAEEISEHLTEDELAVIASFRMDDRKREWAATRIAAKLLAIDLRLCTVPRDCSIPTHSERPFLRLPGEIENVPHCSLSHSGGFGAAIIDDTPVGIDLQELTEIQPRTQKYFLNDDERPIADEVSIAEPLLHLLAAKEAVWKLEPGEGWYRSGRVVLERETSDGLILEFRREATRGTVETRRLDERFVLAVAMPSRGS